MEYGYARCSTNENKQDISRQIKELQEMGVSRSNIFLEYESGTKLNRIELARLLATVSQGDSIISTEVSRITRSTKQLCEIIETAKEKHLLLRFGTFIVDCTKELDAMTEGMLKMMGVFSEIERKYARLPLTPKVIDEMEREATRLVRRMITTKVTFVRD